MVLQGEACERRGAIIVARRDPTSYNADTTERWVIGTNCKTWRCPTCRKKRQAMVKMRMVYGCTILEDSWFITLTYWTGDSPREDAQSVGKDWYRFLKRWRALNPHLSWFRVIELTNQNQPHLHLLAGGLQDDKAHEVESTVRDSWALATRRNGAVQSFIVKAIKVAAPTKVAGYMAKYMVKAFYDQRSDLEQMGFLRRFSRSRNWPSPGEIHLEGLVNGTLINLGYRNRSELSEEEYKNLQRVQEVYPAALARTGDDLALALGYKFNRMRPLNKLKGRITRVQTATSSPEQSNN